MKIYVTRNNEPIFETGTGISAGKETLFGSYRDRYPDNGWSELRRVNMEIGGVKEVKLTKELKEVLITDLAYCYGGNSSIFLNKLKEFKIL